MLKRQFSVVLTFFVITHFESQYHLYVTDLFLHCVPMCNHLSKIVFQPIWQIIKQTHSHHLSFHDKVLCTVEMKTVFISLCLSFKVLMKDIVTPVPQEEVKAVIRKCLEQAALVNYQRLSEYAKLEGKLLLIQCSYLNQTRTFSFMSVLYWSKSTAWAFCLDMAVNKTALPAKSVTLRVSCYILIHMWMILNAVSRWFLISVAQSLQRLSNYYWRAYIILWDSRQFFFSQGM